MRIRFLLLIVLHLTGLFSVAAQYDKASRSAPFLTGVDHVYVFAEKVNIESLFKVFRDDFRIPQVWAFKDYGGFSSGSVSAGNVVLEFATFEDPTNKSPKTEFQGIVFEPVADAVATDAILTSRGIPHGPPEAQNPSWTIIPFTHLPPSNVFVMLCDYKDRRSVAELQSKAAAKLTETGGGNLGMVSVKEIIVGVKDLNDARVKWALAMGRKIGSSDRFKFSRGPDVRLVQNNAPGILEIAIRVRSKAGAKRFLESRKILGADGRDEMTIKPSAIGGLLVRLVEN